MIALALLAAAPLACGAVPRPGVAFRDDQGEWRGAAVDACRRAAHRLGRPGIAFRAYRTPSALRRSAEDDLSFLTAAERRFAGSGVVVAPGIAASTQLLVARMSSIAGDRPTLCFIIGSAAEDALATWLAADHRDAIPLGFQEPDEMTDGLISGKCAGMAIDAADRTAGETIVTTLSTTPIDAVTGSAKTSASSAALR